MEKSVVERFLEYVKVDTASSEESSSHPSTEKQFNLAKMLVSELSEMGVKDVVFDEEHCYVYGKIPGNSEGKRALGFISHMDTSPEASGENVCPRIIKNYDGGDIVLNSQQGIVTSVKTYPELEGYKGKTLIVTDGTTLLGADDKAGVAEIMTMAQELINHPEISHGDIAIAFTPDEEIGCGVDFFDIEKFGVPAAFTVDGGALGELEYENFNAASADIKIHGVNIHPGAAKDKMINACLTAMEIDGMLPKDRPCNTEGYEGFFHLTSMDGNVEEANLHYIIRDHSRGKFEERKAVIKDICEKAALKTGAVINCEVKDQYYNMREIIEDGNMFLVEAASEEMKKLGVTPITNPIRGGTDGAMLSFRGLPCPNLCTGGMNYHSRFEYCCVEDMETIVKILVGLASR